MSVCKIIKFAVVIPFFQRESKILSRCLKSILEQTALHLVHEIIVVDDGSPVSAESEVNELGSAEISSVNIRIIKQNNSGVSAARNKALDSVSAQVTHIAYLDSDDIWLPHHLEYAKDAIEHGAGFYFSDHVQLNSTSPAFGKASNFFAASHFSFAPDLYKFSGCFVNQVIRSNPVGTSTVVHELISDKDLRFDKKYSYAGEDYMMWISLARNVNLIFFSTKVSAIYGSGVNIFSGASWGSKHLSLRIIDEIKYRQDCLSLPEISQDNHLWLRLKISELKRHLARNVLSQLKRLDFSGLILYFEFNIKN